MGIYPSTCTVCGNGFMWFSGDTFYSGICPDCRVPETNTNKYMGDINHSEMVKALAKSGEDIVAELTPEEAHLWHMATGVSGEAGELLDAVKKAVIYRKPLDRENIVEELGDLEFYMEGLRQGLGITREETIEHNIAKLSVRYHTGKFSNEDAQERADKPEGQ